VLIQNSEVAAARELVGAAASRIRTRGWWGAGGNPGDEKCCTWTALYQERDTAVMRVYEEAERLVASAIGYDPTAPDAEFETITRWNDVPGRAVDQVLAMLDGVAAG
jgi:hypothetical protein